MTVYPASLWPEWPGKSASVSEGPPYPAVLHMLDVAAVAEVLIKPFDLPDRLKDALVLLVALHDIGKVSDCFRAMLLEGKSQRFWHWELSEVLLRQQDCELGAVLGANEIVRFQLYAAVAGHHGRPSSLALGGFRAPGAPMLRGTGLAEENRQIGAGATPALQIMRQFSSLWPDASLEGLDESGAKIVSWWLAGLCTVADWIGSNTQWFGQWHDADDMAEHLRRATLRATEAVQEIGFGGGVIKSEPLFDFEPRPMQCAAGDVPLPEGPTLAIIEDETGAGKTEAALILAQRMLVAGKGRGLYFALPTMATADAMFLRARAVIGRLFEKPSLTLAHGRAGLSAAFRDLQSVSLAADELETGPTCSEWIAQSTRRALLADVGVGTIDQALSAVLPIRFQTMRHFGLSSKVLIVDEVHEMGEPYIAEELVALLRLHRAAGGSAILLTATLPMALRAKLLATYDGQSPDRAYPALTVASGAAVHDFPPEARPKKGPVRIERFECPDLAVALIVEKARDGASCVWVRNAVDDAIAAVTALQEQGIEARLLHARFTLADRKRIEAEVASRVGKDGRGREGFVLVGTQVLESSLDFDFDVMVSDIAPIAALIQRAGRLWRHMDVRPLSSRPVSEPVLYVVSPDPDRVEDSAWLKRCLDRGAYTYAVSEVWRSARVLFQSGEIRAPEGLRDMIEAVYADEAVDVPEALRRAEEESSGKAYAHRSQALHNIVDISAGYRAAGRGDDEASYPTRLGGETRKLLLLREVEDQLQPWASGENAWPMSEVSARQTLLARVELPRQDQPAFVTVTKDWPEWRKREVTLCIVSPEGCICDGLSYEANKGLIFSTQRGL